jgi:hypothetical protein
MHTSCSTRKLKPSKWEPRRKLFERKELGATRATAGTQLAAGWTEGTRVLHLFEC